MSFTTSERIVIDEAAAAAAKAVWRDVVPDIQRIVQAAICEAAAGNTKILELLEGVANAQVSAAGTYAATIKQEIAAARKKSG